MWASWPQHCTRAGQGMGKLPESPQQARLTSLVSRRIEAIMSSPTLFGLGLALLLVASTAFAQKAPPPKKNAPAKSAPTVAEAEAFMKKAEPQLEDLGIRSSRANWVQE